MAPEPRARLEVPIFGPDDGPLAVSLGASRLELNRAGSYALGGTTPTLAELTTLLTSLTPTPISTSTPTSPNHTQRVPIRIMIRPRGPPPTITITTTTTTTTTPSSQNKPQNNSSQTTPQDFIYTPTEHATMASSIREFATSGLLSPALGDGFVLGVLRRSNDDDGRVVLDGERHRELVGYAGQVPWDVISTAYSCHPPEDTPPGHSTILEKASEASDSSTRRHVAASIPLT
ncbi:uncharacterized protein B0H64DRAFT_472535 [Chaetomium fimeti]|uniref:Copper homeostasis protein cutC homolog n=1 Tax=Chaetomium fimeti TaxID=1854472 RepID=A0AAE0HMR3_9PEZI|nr:hypothetical protein B0H64DRAFT_472535 [Chaetomium fimeti]